MALCYGATVLPKEEPVPFYKKEYWLWALLVVVHLCRTEHHLLVTRDLSRGEKEASGHYAWFRNSDLVFYRRSAADLWRADLGYGIFEVATGNYPRGVQLTKLHTPIWWGGLLAAARGCFTS